MLKLFEKAIELGLTKESAEAFVNKQIAKEEEDKLREERIAERNERISERNEKKLFAELADKEEARKHELEMAKLKFEAGASNVSENRFVSSLPKIPPFDDKIDDIETYLQRFEKLAKFHKWEQSEYAPLLGTLLRGKSLKTYCSLASDIADDYDKLKKALLKSFHVNPNEYRKKFREGTINIGESYVQLVCRLRQF